MARKIPKLHYWAQKYARMYWGRDFEHPILWYKMKRYNGLVTFWKKDCSVKDVKMHPNTIIEGKFHEVLKHELCHYFLIRNGIIHGEYDERFLAELRRVGGIMPKKLVLTKFHCSSCNDFVYETKSKRINWDKFLAFKRCSCYIVRARIYRTYEDIK